VRLSLGSSTPEVKSRPTFRVTYPTGHLPGFAIVVVAFFVVFVVVLLVVVVGIFVVLFVGIVDVLKDEAGGRDINKTVSQDDTGPVPADAAGLGLSRFGGGYVVQKCRPHFGQTQNWSGGHGIPGAGSRRSICVPHR